MAAFKVRQDLSFANGTFGEYESRKSSQNALNADLSKSLVIDSVPSQSVLSQGGASGTDIAFR